VFNDAFQTAVRAKQLTQFIRSNLRKYGRHINISVIIEEVDALLKDTHVRDMGLDELVCQIHAHSPDHTFCPSHVFLSSVLQSCNMPDNMDIKDSETDGYRLAIGFLRSMRHALRTVGHRVRLVARGQAS